MIYDEIEEYPYTGVITRTTAGKGDGDDITTTLYSGKMDLTLQTDSQGRVLQTAGYIVSIPLTKDNGGKYIIPHKSDKILLTRYGETLMFTVDNAEPSQLGGISIYVTRNQW